MRRDKEGKDGKTLGEELASAEETPSEDEGGKKRKKISLKKKLLAIPIIVVLVAVLAGVAWKRFSGGPPEKADREMIPQKANCIEKEEEEGEETVPRKAPNPHAKEEEVTASAATATEVNSMTMSESIEYIEGLNPQSLGLEGSSMDEYEVFPTVGTVLVDGLPCTEVYVYRQNTDTGTNMFQGSYLLDRSGNALYALDRDQGVVTQLQPLSGDGG